MINGVVFSFLVFFLMMAREILFGDSLDNSRVDPFLLTWALLRSCEKLLTRARMS